MHVMWLFVPSPAPASSEAVSLDVCVIHVV